jgi:diguanylate cyclase (GGDEF)-like protein
VNRRADGEEYAVEQTITPIVEAGVVTHFVSVQNDVSELVRDRERLFELATHDSLTGLANRSRLELALLGASREAKRSGETFALLYLDLDGFKQVNDTFGHHAGDLVLVCVARRLEKAVREVDLVARMGGDEFAVIAPRISNEAGARRAADRMRGAISQPISVVDEEGAPHLVNNGGSVGVALGTGASGEGETLLRRADAAMYAAKRGGPGAGVGVAPDRTPLWTGVLDGEAS